MFFEVLHRILSFDFAWLAMLFFNNLHYFFAFFAITFIFWNSSAKKAIVATFLLSLLAWVWQDFETISGWVLFVGGFLSIYYVTKIVVMAFAEQVPQLKNYLVVVSEAQFLFLLIIYNLFLR